MTVCLDVTDTKSTVQWDPWLQDLAERYPRLFGEQTFELGAFINPGWRPIVADLMQQLDALLSDDDARRFLMVQAKEKFGGLRFYWEFDSRGDQHVDLQIGGQVVHMVQKVDDPSGTSGRIRALVDQASRQAAQTCEICGRTGRLRQNDWWATLCDEHDAQQ